MLWHLFQFRGPKGSCVSCVFALWAARPSGIGGGVLYILVYLYANHVLFVSSRLRCPLALMSCSHCECFRFKSLAKKKNEKIRNELKFFTEGAAMAIGNKCHALPHEGAGQLNWFVMLVAGVRWSLVAGRCPDAEQNPVVRWN